MNNILLEIAAHKEKEVEQLKKKQSLDQIIERIGHGDVLDFRAAIANGQKINIIAEIKKASPSKGTMLHNFDPAVLAGQFRAGGAAALSVLADEKYFHGSYEFIAVAKKSSGLPVLCKEFIIDKYQIYFARMMKADAVLLIVKLLGKKKLQEMLEQAKLAGLAALVEVQNIDEMKMAVDSGADIIGVNNRNLEDFSVSLETSEKLSPLIPGNVIKVAESGIFNTSHIKRLKEAGYNNFLIGEALITSNDSIKLLRELRSV